jgi:hypothetical protein
LPSTSVEDGNPGRMNLFFDESRFAVGVTATVTATPANYGERRRTKRASVKYRPDVGERPQTVTDGLKVALGTAVPVGSRAGAFWVVKEKRWTAWRSSHDVVAK